MNNEFNQILKNPIRVTVLLFAVAGLACVYLFQKRDVWGLVCNCSSEPWVHFAINKSIRLLVNDLFMLTIIYFWFYDKTVTRLALWIQLVDTFVFLPIYLILKLKLEGESEISSPLLSQFHRLIINPTLMILLFPAIYFQRYGEKKN
jgi:exosortase F-associated protein